MEVDHIPPSSQEAPSSEIQQEHLKQCPTEISDQFTFDSQQNFPNKSLNQLSNKYKQNPIKKPNTNHNINNSNLSNQVSQVLRTADLYQIFGLAMRQNQSQQSQEVGRHIKRALERQINGSISIIDDNEEFLQTSHDTTNNFNLLREVNNTTSFNNHNNYGLNSKIENNTTIANDNTILLDNESFLICSNNYNEQQQQLQQVKSSSPQKTKSSNKENNFQPKSISPIKQNQPEKLMRPISSNEQLICSQQQNKVRQPVLQEQEQQLQFQNQMGSSNGFLNNLQQIQSLCSEAASSADINQKYTLNECLQILFGVQQLNFQNKQQSIPPQSQQQLKNQIQCEGGIENTSNSKDQKQQPLILNQEEVVAPPIETEYNTPQIEKQQQKLLYSQNHNNNKRSLNCNNEMPSNTHNNNNIFNSTQSSRMSQAIVSILNMDHEIQLRGSSQQQQQVNNIEKQQHQKQQQVYQEIDDYTFDQRQPFKNINENQFAQLEQNQLEFLKNKNNFKSDKNNQNFKHPQQFQISSIINEQVVQQHHNNSNNSNNLFTLLLPSSQSLQNYQSNCSATSKQQYSNNNPLSSNIYQINQQQQQSKQTSSSVLVPKKDINNNISSVCVTQLNSNHENIQQLQQLVKPPSLTKCSSVGFINAPNSVNNCQTSMIKNMQNHQQQQQLVSTGKFNQAKEINFMQNNSDKFTNTNVKQNLEKISIKKVNKAYQQNQQQSQNSSNNDKLELKKQRLLQSFHEINYNIIVEVGRIKKPQKIAFQAGKMLVQLVLAFREKQNLASNVEMEYSSWSQVQAVINQNVNKFSQEVMSIKSKIFENLSNISRVCNIDRIQRLKSEFFLSSKMSLFKALSTNKNIRAIVYLVYNIVSYVLARQQIAKEGELSSLFSHKNNNNNSNNGMVQKVDCISQLSLDHLKSTGGEEEGNGEMVSSTHSIQNDNNDTQVPLLPLRIATSSQQNNNQPQSTTAKNNLFNYINDDINKNSSNNNGKLAYRNINSARRQEEEFRFPTPTSHTSSNIDLNSSIHRQQVVSPNIQNVVTQDKIKKTQQQDKIKSYNCNYGKSNNQINEHIQIKFSNIQSKILLRDKDYKNYLQKTQILTHQHNQRQLSSGKKHNFSLHGQQQIGNNFSQTSEFLFDKERSSTPLNQKCFNIIEKQQKLFGNVTPIQVKSKDQLLFDEKQLQNFKREKSLEPQLQQNKQQDLNNFLKNNKSSFQFVSPLQSLMKEKFIKRSKSPLQSQKILSASHHNDSTNQKLKKNTCSLIQKQQVPSSLLSYKKQQPFEQIRKKNKQISYLELQQSSQQDQETTFQDDQQFVLKYLKPETTNNNQEPEICQNRNIINDKDEDLIQRQSYYGEDQQQEEQDIGGGGQGTVEFTYHHNKDLEDTFVQQQEQQCINIRISDTKINDNDQLDNEEMSFKDDIIIQSPKIIKSQQQQYQQSSPSQDMLVLQTKDQIQRMMQNKYAQLEEQLNNNNNYQSISSSSTQKRKINFDIIEELKSKRLSQHKRIQGEELEMQRDNMIKDVQNKMMLIMTQKKEQEQI